MRRLLLFLALALASFPASAQYTQGFGTGGVGYCCSAYVTPPAYVGGGVNDAVPGVYEYWGLRAVDTAHATGLVSGADIYCYPTAATTTGITLLTSGFLNMAQIASACPDFAAAFQGYIDATTGTLHVTTGPVQGAIYSAASNAVLICPVPVTCPAFAYSITAGSGVTWTTSYAGGTPIGSVGSPLTFWETGIRVAKLYGQIGGYNATQATPANMPYFVPYFLKSNTQPAMVGYTNKYLVATLGGTQAQPFSVHAVFGRYNSVTSALYAAYNSNLLFGTNAAAGQLQCLGASSTVVGTSTIGQTPDANIYAAECTLNGTSSKFWVNGAFATTQSGNAQSAALGTGINLMGNTTFNDLIGAEAEVAIYPTNQPTTSGFGTTTNAASILALHSNACNFWGCP